MAHTKPAEFHPAEFRLSGEAEPKPVLTIPLRDNGTHRVMAEDLDRYAKMFPNLDVEAQLRMCAEWNRVNSGRRKTRRGVERHILTWLGSAADRARDSRPRYAGPNLG